MEIDKLIIKEAAEEIYTDFGIYRWYARNYKKLKISFALYIAIITGYAFDLFTFYPMWLVWVLMVYIVLAVLAAVDHYFIGRKLFEIQDFLERKTGFWVSIKTIGEVIDEMYKTKTK